MGMGSMGNMNSMIKQAQKMQADMQKMQAEIAAKEFEVKAGGGAVTVTLNGEKKISAIKLEPDIVDPDDIEMLEDILVAAVNEALKTVDDYSAAELKKITGGLNMPGMF